VAVVAGEADDQRRGRFGQAVAEARILGAEHLGDALDLRGLGRRVLRARAGAEDGHVAQLVSRR
jgi:hypothetical protein